MYVTLKATRSKNMEVKPAFSEGHIDLSNEKREEITIGNFHVALPYLKKDETTAYFVIHVYSNTFDYSPYPTKK